jgi:hypothetical protein
MIGLICFKVDFLMILETFKSFRRFGNSQKFPGGAGNFVFSSETISFAGNF